MARRRYSETRKAALVKEFERSEMTAAAFCRRRRLPYQAFLGWRRDMAGGQGAEEMLEFVELEVGPQAAAGRNAPGERALVELVLGGGMVLRVYGPERPLP